MSARGHLSLRFLAALLALAPFLAARGQLGRYEASFTTSATNFADTIAIEWEQQQVFVPITIEGRRCRFLLDTGAGMTAVFQGTPLAQGPEAGRIISHDATGSTDTVHMVQLPPMTLGSVTLRGCRATVQPRGVGTRGVDGILGFDLVNGGLSVKIDVPARQLIITDVRHLFCREAGIVSTKYQLNFHVPYIEVNPFGNCTERVLFDTGSQQFFAMNKAHFDRALSGKGTKGKSQPEALTILGREVGRHAMGHQGTEPEGEVVLMRLDSLRLAGYPFSAVTSITTQGGSHLGALLLPHGAVAFCPRHRALHFQPLWPFQAKQAGSRACPVGNRQPDIAFVADAQGRPQVGLVWPGTAPYQQGLRQGDVILQIDRRPVASLAQFSQWAFERGRAYTFTLLNPQGRREVQWVRLPK